MCSRRSPPRWPSEFEGQVLRGRRSPGAASYHLHDVGGRRSTCHGRFRIPYLTADADQDDPRHQLTCPLPYNRCWDRHRPAHPGPPRCRVHPVLAETLPKNRGCSATVVVTMTLQQLLADLDAAGLQPLDTGGRISAAGCRLACSAGIIPSSWAARASCPRRRPNAEPHRSHAHRHGHPRRRLHQRCEAPPGLCHAHHDTPWPPHGGPTNIDTGRSRAPPPPPHPRPRLPPHPRPSNGKIRFQLTGCDLMRVGCSGSTLRARCKSKVFGRSDRGMSGRSLLEDPVAGSSAEMCQSSGYAGPRRTSSAFGVEDLVCACSAPATAEVDGEAFRGHGAQQYGPECTTADASRGDLVQLPAAPAPSGNDGYCVAGSAGTSSRARASRR